MYCVDMCAMCMNHTGIKLVALVSILNPLLQLCIRSVCVRVCLRVYVRVVWLMMTLSALITKSNYGFVIHAVFFRVEEIDCRVVTIYTVVQFQIKLRSKCVESSLENIIHAIHTSDEKEASYSACLNQKHTERMSKLWVLYI